MVKPTLQALVLADHIYVDRDSGKKVIAGTFNRLKAETFPAEFGRPTWAYVCLTEIRGRATVELRYVDLSNNQVLMRTKLGDVRAGDPLESIEMVVEVPPFPMPHAGPYALEVHAAGEMLGALRVMAQEISPLGGL